ncbi:beta-arabinofuranosyltransferase RAY1 [Silene latifolia]|uniref:beta-arabinofuranosyltransferase RAY1 n=1 Tax=Silene latifolia TaxID=37657 RepID=UPI003D78AC5E
MPLLPIFTPFRSTKGLKLGLWAIWFYGFLLICISLYATQLLPSVKLEFRKPIFFNKNGVENHKGSPSITIFTVLENFNGSVGERQDLAVRSWLGLSPDINVVLFGNDPSLYSYASGFGSRVLVESDIDFSFRNKLFFHSMVARAEASVSNISVIVHPETVLFQDFISTLNHVHELDHAWFLVAFPRKVPSFRYSLDEAGKQWLKEDGNIISSHKLQEVLAQIGEWDYCDGRMLMAWNNGETPLHMGVLPPFLYGKGLHSRWFINEVYYSKYRSVFDASLSISNFYVNASNDIQSNQEDWEYTANRHLAESYGMFSSKQASFSDFVELVKCGRQFVLVNRKENIVYSHGSKSSKNLLKERVMGSRRRKRLMSCVSAFGPVSKIKDCSHISSINVSTDLHLPFGLESLLPMVADKNNTIVLAIAGYSYKDMLMSWVCRLRHLMVQNFLVFALDDETYQYAILQGLPVVKDSLAPRNISFNDCHFGTKCFQNVTKSKSRLVTRILEMGYNVLLSDVDVYWFKNPLPLLQTFGPAVLVAQSDEYNLTVPINLPRRLNSGFYFARSDKPTIAALDKVVKHAMTSDLSEQPSFYDTLCGQGGLNRVGNDKCWEPATNLTVQFLDRDLFPNGAYKELWNEKSVLAACLKNGCYVLHNNWISGRLNKLQRQVRARLWDYDTSSRMCLQSWHKAKDTDFS